MTKNCINNLAMNIRVLHIFASNYKKRFGGPIFDWKFAFSNWDNPSVEHYVLDYDIKKPVSAKQAFSFEISSSQVMSSRKERILWIFSLLFQLRQFRKEYDIIHFHVLQWAGFLACTWAKWKKIPTIYQSVLQNSDTPSNVNNQRQGKLKGKLLQNFSAILAISHTLSEDYLQHGFSEDKVYTLMNSVETDTFYPVSSPEEKSKLRQKANLPQEATILLFTGSIIHRKGVDILLKSFLDVLSNYPEVFLVLVGPNKKNENPSLDIEFINDLHNLLENKAAQDRVRFTGLVKDRETLAGLYRAADIFIFPSRIEGLGNVVLEAMASGLPVIISDLPPLRNVVIDGTNGIVVPIDDVEKLSQVIIQLLKDPYLSENLKINARDYIENNHSFSEWQSRLVKIYNEVWSAN